MGTTTSLAVWMTAICLNPLEDLTRDKVDLIEVNHFYDEQGRLVFDQIIFYDWSPMECRYQVRDWRLLKSPSQLPRRNRENGRYVSLWHDGETLRRVEAPSVRESWTQYDPELVERDYLPKEKRRQLRKLNLAKLFSN